MNVPKKTRPNSNSHRGNNKYYQTREWKRLRDQVWLRDEGMCKQCEREGRLMPLARGKNHGVVDHIKPRERGGKDSMDNLELLCKPHHDSKSSYERKNIS
ncbi:MAG: HNH endonuclease [Lewinella sp.]|uniref:HNH endonuclease n=1 Tax=Lewinella sp. TaxID=2004506 RepID=UPI003D6A6CF4